jgi:hypothetical protein
MAASFFNIPKILKAGAKITPKKLQTFDVGK